MQPAPARSTASQDVLNRRLAGGLLLSLLVHGLVLSIQFGLPDFAPGLKAPLTVTIAPAAAVAPPAPAVAALPPAPTVEAAPVAAPSLALAPQPRQGMTLVDPVAPPTPPAPPTPAPTQRKHVAPRKIGKPRARAAAEKERLRVIAQEQNQDPSFVVPLAPPDEAGTTSEPRAAQAGVEGGTDDSAPPGDEAKQAEANQAALAAELENADKERQRLAQQRADEDRRLADETARRQADALAQLQQQADEAQHNAAQEQARQLAQQRVAAEAEAEARAQAQQLADEQNRLLARRQADAELARAEAARREQEQQRSRAAADALAAGKLAEEETRRQAARELARQRASELDAVQRQAEDMAARQRAELLAKQQAEQLAARRQAEELARQNAEQLVLQRQAEERARRQREELLARQEAEQLAARRQADERAQQQAEQVAARQRADERARQEAEQLAARRQADELARQQAELAERQRGAEAARRLAQEGPRRVDGPVTAGGASGPGGSADAGQPGAGAGAGSGSVTVPKNMLGSEVASRARDLMRGIDVLRPLPPAARPAEDALRARRRAGADAAQRDVPLRMYMDSFRQKIERNGAMAGVPLAADQVRIDPLVSVTLRSDGSVDEVTIVRSSGRPEMDEAVRRLVRLNARYSAFPPNVAALYDVIEIRRIWRFAEGLKLLEEVR